MSNSILLVASAVFGLIIILGRVECCITRYPGKTSAPFAVQQQNMFVLHHKELTTVRVDVDTPDSVDVGAKVIVRRNSIGIRLYTDELTGLLRSDINDLCIQANEDGFLEFALCRAESWRFYLNETTFASGIVQGRDDDVGGESGMRIAVWDDKSDVYGERGISRLVSKPFAEFERDFGAAWSRTYV